MDEVVKFDYTAEQLNSVVAEASQVDKTDLEAVKETHKKLVTIRTTITKKGKELRDGAIKYQKAVIEKEKEYLGITAPVEDELKGILDAEKERVVMEARKELLPQKRDQLALLTHKQEISDDAILAMDDAQWVDYYQNAMAFDQREKQRILDEAESEKNREEREAQIREDERKKLEDENLKREEQKKREEEEARKKRESDEQFQKFLIENDYNADTDRTVEKDGVVRLYRLVAEYKK